MTYQTSCPKCPSSDAFTVYDDHSYCFSCGYWEGHKNKRTIEERNTKRMTNTSTYPPTPFTFTNLEQGHFAIDSRGISPEVVEKYGVKVYRDSTTKEEKKHEYIYNGLDGNSCVKERILPKQFYADGSISNTELFGQSLFPSGSATSITVVEGELDALAAHQMWSMKWPVVSVPSASQAKKAIRNNLEYLESFQNVVLCFDNDDAGKKAMEECAVLFSPRKCRLFQHTQGFKDACDYLIKGKVPEYQKGFYNAKVWVPEGIVAASSLWERIINKKDIPSIPYPWDKINKMTYGIRKGEMVCFCAPTNVGKTQLMRELEYGILKADPEARIGGIFMEETVETSALGLMSVHASKPLHLPDTEYTEEELARYYNDMFKDERVFFYNSDAGVDIEEIVAKIHFYVQALECHYIFLDNFTILTSNHSNGDERKRIDEAMVKLRQLAKDLDIALITVAHLNREGQIRGSTAIENFANLVVFLSRDLTNEDPEVRNIMELTINKNRFCGRTGPAGKLKYIPSTGRMEEIEEFEDRAYTPPSTTTEGSVFKEIEG